MALIPVPSHDTEILTRLVGADGLTLSPAAAKGILALAFSEADKNRMHSLAAKAREGKLTVSENSEVEAYSRINSLLGILKSKARRALKRHATNGKAKSH
jgi:hypothetical protein